MWLTGWRFVLPLQSTETGGALSVNRGVSQPNPPNPPNPTPVTLHLTAGTKATLVCSAETITGCRRLRVRLHRLFTTFPSNTFRSALLLDFQMHFGGAGSFSKLLYLIEGNTAINSHPVYLNSHLTKMITSRTEVFHYKDKLGWF